MLPPLTPPGEFAQVEAPQLVRLNGRYEILVSCLAEDHSQRADGEARHARTRPARSCSRRTSSLGPYALGHGPIARPTARSARSTPASSSRTETGSWRFMAFRGDGDRDFLGELTDPLPVRTDGEGRILVDLPEIPAGATS